MSGETEVDVGEVDQDGDIGAVAADGAHEAAIAGVDLRDMAQDLGDAHDGDVFGADDALLARSLHRAAAEAGEGGCGQMLAKVLDELGAVGLAGGLAGGEEDARGWSGWR